MRYVFYFVALLSAFFSYAAYDPELGYDPEDLKTPDYTETTYQCNFLNNDLGRVLSLGACAEQVTLKIHTFFENDCGSYVERVSGGRVYYMAKRTRPDGACYGNSLDDYMSLTDEIPAGPTCPPAAAPLYKNAVITGQDDDGNDIVMCAKPFENPNSCPTVSDDSLSTINFTSPDVNSVCFDNPNGEGECAYEVTNGMYNLPPELSTAEPVECGSNEPVTDDTPPLDPEENCYETTNGAYCNEDPDEKCSVVTDSLTGDSYTQCQENCGYINGDFFCLDDGTDTPDEPPAPSECQDPAYRAANPNKCKSNQDTDKDGDGQVDNTDVVEAINQLASQGDDRANTLNKLLGEAIDGNGLVKEGNKLLKKISDNLDKEDQNEQPFTATAERKGQGPLDSLFNDTWTAETEASIESLKSDIGNFRQQIQSDMDSIFSLSSFSGSYSQIKHQIFGVDTDFSMSRFQELFQALAAAFMFVAVIYAVYILLS